MSMVRSLERRLERLLDGVAGKVFSGRVHPAEIAGRLAREADLARFEHQTGPATANVYTLTFNPRDLTEPTTDLESSLAAELSKHIAQEGLRLEGPCQVRLEVADRVPRGSVSCHVEVSPGPREVWARLTASESVLEIGRNRVLVGRSSECDVVVPGDDVSRTHALIWREGGSSWIADRRSANGTKIDNVPVGRDPVILESGSLVTFASRRYRFVDLSLPPEGTDGGGSIGVAGTGH